MKPSMALLAAFLAALAAACGPEVTAQPEPTALTGVVVKRSPGGLLIVQRDDLTTVLINDRQAFGACHLHDRYPACAERR